MGHGYVSSPTRGLARLEVLPVVTQLQSHGEPDEILKSYSISYLRISGNATRLAPWDSKLGLQAPALRFATLRSLNPDGGLVPLMDIIIERNYQRTRRR